MKELVNYKLKLTKPWEYLVIMSVYLNLSLNISTVLNTLKSMNKTNGYEKCKKYATNYNIYKMYHEN